LRQRGHPEGLPAAATVTYLCHIMLASPRTLPTGFIAPCLPTTAHTLPSGGLWLHEIKHDGFRIIARKDGEGMRLYSRPGNDFTRSFPLIVEALARLRSRSCIIDGEAVACDDNGLASFDRIRYRRYDASVSSTPSTYACKMGLEGIVSKRKGSAYRSGRSPDWLKMKNPNAAAVTREAEEDWGKQKWR
jgi:bifunctional non-homologous end joining protein LigD